MSKQQSIDGRGGSYTVGADKVEQNEGSGTLNPGDPGYTEAVRKVPLHDAERKGAFNRTPTFRDLEEKPKKPKTEKTTEAAPAASPQGGKR